ncbi:MAG TPA: lytic transglycosylase domain-containing protein [Nautiliaceae bacterium]|nr:lytic transglycosylase domain-containing protein [Nautiliaceae bacterium]
MIILFIPFFLFALNLSEILSKPKSYVRDFYLTEFMRETNSTILAYKAYNALYKKRPFKHLRLLAKKDKAFEDIYKCINVMPYYVREVDVSCILENGLSLRSIATKLSKKDLKYLYNNLPNSKEKKAIEIILTNDFSKIFKDKELGYYFVLRYPTKKIDQYVDDFSLFYGRDFHLFVKLITLKGLPKLQASLMRIDYKNLDDKSKWWLFINALSNNNKELAKKVLYSINKKNNKIYFWMWQLGDKSVLNKLLKNKRVDFYTLYAYEEANKTFVIKDKIVFNTIKNPKYAQTNPWDVLKFFDELRVRDDLFNFAKELDSYKSEALKAIVLDKAFGYKYNFFITSPIYEDTNKSFKAFVYGIIRQESRFIPAIVSSAYALGPMQIMPFLVREYNSNVFKQFDYNENVKLGVKHLKWLFKNLNDPLMVAYAYNGGIGFVKRRVKPGFKYKGKYEPFLSMERVLYDESREYGKKVIANYIIYSHLFGDKNITLHKLLKK